MRYDVECRRLVCCVLRWRHAALWHTVRATQQACRTKWPHTHTHKPCSSVIINIDTTQLERNSGSGAHCHRPCASVDFLWFLFATLHWKIIIIISYVCVINLWKYALIEKWSICDAGATTVAFIVRFFFWIFVLFFHWIGSGWNRFNRVRRKHIHTQQQKMHMNDIFLQLMHVFPSQFFISEFFISRNWIVRCFVNRKI